LHIKVISQGQGQNHMCCLCFVCEPRQLYTALSKAWQCSQSF